MNLKVKIFLLIISNVFICCGTLDTNTSRDKLLKYNDKGYSISLNGKLINLSNNYLDRKNIEKILKSESKKQIEILQKNQKSKFVSLNEIQKTDSIARNADIIVVEGSIVEKINFDKIFIENSSITGYQYLSQKQAESSIGGCRRFENGIILLKLN